VRFGTKNVRNLYKSGALTAAPGELARHKLGIVGVQEVRWDREGTVRAGDYNFFYGKGGENYQLKQNILYTIAECQQLRE